MKLIIAIIQPYRIDSVREALTEVGVEFVSDRALDLFRAAGQRVEDGTVYLLIDEEHDPRRDGLTEFRQKAIEHMAHIVTITGTATEVGGQKAIFVQGFVKK